MNYLPHMDINIRLIFVLVILSACQACKECIETTVHPPQEVTFSIFPEQLTYHVGDSLIFESRIDRSIFPAGFNSMNDKIGSQISCVRFLLDSSITAIPAAESFEGKLIHGKNFFFIRPDSIRLKAVNLLNFTYDLIDSVFIVKALVIPKDTGFFGLEPFSYGINLNLGSNCEDFFSGRVYYDNEHTNVEIKEFFYKQEYPGKSKRNTYCIHVIK